MTTYIGPFGRLLAIDAPTPGMDGTVTRASREIQLITGTTRRQRAPKVARRWTWEIPLAKADELSSVVGLERGMFGPPPFYWYDPVSAFLNMLSDQASSPGLGGPDWWRPFTTDPADVQLAGPVDIDGGRTLASSIEPLATLTIPADRELPVLEGRTYTASMFTGVADATVELGWIDAAGAPVGTPQSSGAGSGRRVATGTAPSGAAGATLTVTAATGGIVSGLQLTETPAAVPWHPGLGIPQIDFAGEAVSYRLITAQQQLRRVSLDLVEVS